MKKVKIIITGFVVFCFVNCMYGQTESGKLLLGGQTKLSFVSFNSKWKTDEDEENAGKSSEFELSPQLGFFVANGLVFGVDLLVNHSSEIDENDDKYTSTSTALAPFLRYYFGSSIIRPYFQGEIGFGSVNMKYEPNIGYDDKSSASMFLYEFGTGFGIFLNEKASLDIEIGYAFVSVKPKEDNDNNYRNISEGFGVGIGFVFIL